MTRNEFQTWFFEQVTPRWPKWKYGVFDVGDWFAAFGRYSRESLTSAVMKLRTHEPGASPNTKKLLEIVRAIRPPKPKQRVTEEDEGTLMPISEIKANFPKRYPLKDRVKMIAILHKIGRDARAIDEEAFKIACEKGLIVTKAKSKGQKEKQSLSLRGGIEDDDAAISCRKIQPEPDVLRLPRCACNDSKSAKTEKEKEQSRLRHHYDGQARLDVLAAFQKEAIAARK